MKVHTVLFAAFTAIAISITSLPQTAFADAAHPRVRIKTNMGAIVLELDAQRAPITVKNFLQYVHDKHYEGTLFHRAIPGFVIQGGGYTDKLVEKPTRAPVPNESGNGLSNRRGTVGLARTGDPHSGTSQFYINLGENLSLDPQPSRWGYAVFGRVVEGLDVAQKISEVPTGVQGTLEDAPTKPVIIEKVEIVE